MGYSCGYTGYIRDDETGLNFARARMYSPITGRFVGRDPLGYVDGFGLYIAYFIPNRLDPWGLEDYQVDCGKVQVNIRNNPPPPQITFRFIKEEAKTCCCTAFGFIQHVSRSPGIIPWRYDNGAGNNLPANGFGSQSDPSSPNQPGENNRPPMNPNPPNAQSPWPGNPWYGGGNADGQNPGGAPTSGNPSPSPTNPNPSDNIGDAPTFPRGLYFIVQLVCQDNGKVVWQYSWNNVGVDGDPGPITGAPSDVPAPQVQP